MAEKNIENIISDLHSRTQELDSLYKIDELLNNYDFSIQEIINHLTEIIPQIFRHQNICVAKIRLGENTSESENFEISHLKLNEEIISDREKVGEITVVYTKPVREEKGVFLENEKLFLKTTAVKLGAYYYYKHLRETIAKLQETEIEVKKETRDEKLWKWLEDQGLSSEEITKILKVKIDFKKGETILKQGAMASYIILLTNGLSKNYLEGFHERGFIFKIIKPFNFIGISALYGNNNFAFSGSALTNCSAYLIDSLLIKNIITNNEAFAKKMLNWYCNTTYGHLNRMSSLANKQSLGRFSEILLYLSNEIFEGSINTTNVSRKDIAELAAISTESGVRFLSDLKKDGIIKIFPNKIEIIKPQVLKMISG